MLGGDHPRTVATMENPGTTYRRQGRLNDVDEEVLEMVVAEKKTQDPTAIHSRRGCDMARCHCPCNDRGPPSKPSPPYLIFLLRLAMRCIYRH